LARLFISHSSIDNAAAIALRDWLFELGFRDEVFLDIDPERGLVAGQRWQEALKAAADRCEAVLFLVSPAWLSSAWCRAEFLLAKSLQKRIFGLIIEPVPIEQVPVEMTAEWQICELVGEDPLRVFDVTLGSQRQQVTFREAGLDALRRGLERAGLGARSFPWPPADEQKRAPYRGLRALEPQDAAIFFGRDAAIVRGLDRVRGLLEGGIEKFLVVLGASGAGKSSFLRAGLYPRLVRDDATFLPLSVIRPESAAISGSQGLAQSLADTFERLNAPRKLGDIKELLAGRADGLALLLDELGPLARRRLVGAGEANADPAIVIPIDQAEELFNADGHAEAEQFLALVAGVLGPATPARRVLVMATIRSDRYELLQRAPSLTDVRQALFSLAPIGASEFRSVIEGPARRVVEAGGKLEIEPDLTEQLIADAQGPDALPLLAFSLEALYRDNRSAGKLTLADYRRLGGVQGSISAAVARALAEPGAQPAIPADMERQYAALRAAFIPWLARIDPVSGIAMRRVARSDEIPAEAGAIVQRLVRERLLVSDRRDGVDVLEIAHESLLRQWPALAAWLEADAENLKLIDSVERAADEWAANGRLPAWLDHRAQRLAAAERLAERDDFRRRIGPDAEAYLAACRQRDDADMRRQNFFNRLVRTAAVMIAIVAGIAIWQWWQAGQQTQIATQRAALLSTDLAENLTAQNEVDAALLLLLDSARSFNDRTAPDKLLIAMQNAADKARGQESFYFPQSARILAAGDSVYVFDRGKLLRLEIVDGVAALKELGSYGPEVAKIREKSDRSGLIVLRADYGVDVIRFEPYAVEHAGRLVPAGQTVAHRDDAVAVHPDGTVVMTHDGTLYVVDTAGRRSMAAKLPPDVDELFYLATVDGRKVFGANTEKATVYQTDEKFSDLTRATSLDHLWSSVYRCTDVDADVNDATRDYVASKIEWLRFANGDTCIRAGEDYVFLLRQSSTSAGGDYHYEIVDPRDPKGTIEITKEIRTRFGASDTPDENDMLNSVDVRLEDSVFAFNFNRFIFVIGDRNNPGLRQRLAAPPSLLKLLPQAFLAVALKVGDRQKLTIFQSRGRTKPVGSGASAEGAAAPSAVRDAQGPLHNGTCTGYTEVFSNEALMPDGTKLVFDTHRMTSGSGEQKIHIERSGKRSMVDLAPYAPHCVQVNEKFTRLLLSRSEQVDVFDLGVLIRDASLQNALVGSFKHGEYSASAFFVGSTDDVITATNWNNNRVVRWRRGADGYVGETIYTGDRPVIYAEPDRSGKRLLLIESLGNGYVQGLLYSLSAQKKWIDLVSNYKWIGVAFTASGDIRYGAGSDPQTNSQFMKMRTLSEFVDEARRLASNACGVALSRDYARSPCWPDLNRD
jgi:hypothetical protein